MNKYEITLQESWDQRHWTKVYEAHSAADALTMAKFNDCKGTRYENGQPTPSTYVHSIRCIEDDRRLEETIQRLKAVSEEAARLKDTPVKYIFQ